MAVLNMNFLSRSLGYQTNITVCLPSMTVSDAIERSPVYEPGMKFQVLYLLHGGSGDDRDYVTFTNIARYAQESQVCVIMPCGYNSRYTDKPQGPRYYRFVSEELPLVCRTFFPISDRREDTFVAGLSMGGAGAMKLAVMKPETFSKALVMSGASSDPDKIEQWGRHDEMGEADDPDTMPAPNTEAIFGDLSKFRNGPHDVWSQAARNKEEGGPSAEFFFAAGDADIAREATEDAHNYLSSIGYKSSYRLYPGYAHEWDLWERILREAFRENWLGFRQRPILP